MGWHGRPGTPAGSCPAKGRLQVPPTLPITGVCGPVVPAWNGGPLSIRFFVFAAATAGGALGWWLGSGIGIMTAYLLSVVGTALGVYAGRQAAKRYLP